MQCVEVSAVCVLCECSVCGGVSAVCGVSCVSAVCVVECCVCNVKAFHFLGYDVCLSSMCVVYVAWQCLLSQECSSWTA